MDPESPIVPNLIRVANTIAIILIWMISNVFFGLYLNYGFFEGRPATQNYIYWLLAVASFAWLVRHIIKKWRKVY